MTALMLISVVLYAATMILIIESDGFFLPKRMDPVLSARERVILDPKKRPFCNAFTGCGRKRSNLPALSSDGQEMENSINSLLELSAEPSVEDLSRQIMSEAKLWEAIQEANLELKKHKNQPLLPSDLSDEGSRSDRGAISTCALPPCYI